MPNGYYNNEVIKRAMGADVVASLSKFLNDDEEYKLDSKYVGKVVDNDDPKKLGRCRIRVVGLFGDEIQDDELPWALPDFDFVGSLVGSSIIPPIGCIVSVYFDEGEIYLPRYTRKVIDETHLPTNMNTDYPDNMVFFETDNGDKFEINRRRKTVLFEHSSGTKFEIGASGKLKITHVGEWEVNKSIPDPTSGPGPMCGLGQCLYTGTAHQATITRPLGV